MKICPYCNETIQEQETLCPYCGTVQDPILPSDLNQDQQLDHTHFEQTSLFEGAAYNQANGEKSQEASRQEIDQRTKQNTDQYASPWKKLGGFLSYFGDKLIHPSNQFARKRTNSKIYGYLAYALAILIAAGLSTYFVQALIGNYRWLAEISILPSLNASPNYLILFLKFIAFYSLYYLGFPLFSYLIKVAFLKRQHVFHYWVTQYAGMNALAFLFLLIGGAMALIAPLPLLVGILFFYLAHLVCFQVTFTATLMNVANDTSIDSVYLALIGILAQLILSIALVFVLF